MTNEERESAIRCLKLWIEREPYIQTYKTCLEALEQQPYDDAISRQVALKELRESAEHHANDSREEVLLRRDRDIIRALPPVTPQQKIGRWIDYSDEGFVECPFCGHATNCEDNIEELHYCFYCGARMVEPQKSEKA